MITEESFQLWRVDPVTQYVFDLIKDRIRNETEILAATAGKDTSMDCHRVGKIRMGKDILEIEYDD